MTLQLGVVICLDLQVDFLIRVKLFEKILQRKSSDTQGKDNCWVSHIVFKFRILMAAAVEQKKLICQ